MKELENLIRMNSEWDKWQEVCKGLLAAGAVTQADLEASPYGPYDTPGKDLLEAIRQWGDHLAMLRVGQAAQ